MLGSPTTNERYCGSPGGNSYGSNLTPKNIALNRLDHRTSLNNFYFCNASSGYPGFTGSISTGCRLYEHLTGDLFLESNGLNLNIMKIAIIGGGAAGMATAYLLDKQHDVSVFEKQPILGGNIRTLNKNVTGVALDPNVILDNGVIEFQRENFPNFHRLMQVLNVPLSEGRTSSELFLEQRTHVLNLVRASCMIARALASA